MQSPEQFQNTNFGFPVQPILQRLCVQNEHFELEERIAYIEYLTGLINLKMAFSNSDIYDEVDIILRFINKKYNIDDSDTSVLMESIQLIFPSNILDSIGANNEEFYYNKDSDEAIIVILNKLLYKKDAISSSVNGFPESFNHNRINDNKMQITSEGEYWFPFVSNSMDYGLLLDHLLKHFNIDFSKGKLLFHGTSHDSALSINSKVKILPRCTCTDFGLRNFYVTDTFYTACSWANNFNQPAVVFFFVPNEYFNTDNKIIFSPVSNIDNWKETVFKARNPPLRKNYDKQTYQKKDKEYDEYIQELDSKNFIKGPICKTVKAKTHEQIKYIEYYYNGIHTIPEQISFKDTMIPHLNQFILMTLYYDA